MWRSYLLEEMDVNEAVEAMKDIRTKVFVPMYYGENGLKVNSKEF